MIWSLSALSLFAILFSNFLQSLCCLLRLYRQAESLGKSRVMYCSAMAKQVQRLEGAPDKMVVLVIGQAT
jgi:hypothetical protein